MNAPHTAPAEPRIAQQDVRPSLALVPIPPGTGPSPAAVFYGIGYTGVALIILASAIGGWNHDGRDGLYILGAIMVIIAGMFVVVYTLHKPTERKFRQALLAIAVLAGSTLAAYPINQAATEMRLSAQVAKLQPVADEVLRFRRLESWGAYQQLRIAGYYAVTAPDLMASASDSLGRTVNAVLQASGATRDEYDRVVDGLQRAGVVSMEMSGGELALRVRDTREVLLYLPPGRERRPLEPVFNEINWRSKPLGGGWYHLEEARRR